MFSNNGGYSLADIAAATGGSRNNDNGGFGDNGAWWIIILFIFCFAGWGGNGFGGGFGGGGASGALTRADLCQDMNFANVENGIRNISDSVNVGFANLNSTICHQQYDTAALINGVQGAMAAGFAGVDNSVCTLGYQNAALINGLEGTINSNANAANIMALQNQNALQAQLAQCCCDNRAAFADVKYTMATDSCALQNTIQTSTRDLLDNQNANTRAILDYLSQEKISDLQAENQTLRLAASQQAQNNYLVSQLRPTPQPAYLTCNPYTGQVYGGCGYNNSCGCGC